MKKIMSIILVVILCCSLYACGSNSDSEPVTQSLRERAKISVESSIRIHIMVWYDDVSITSITYGKQKEVDSNTFEFSGKVTVKDQYGDYYTGTFDSTVTYNASEDKFDDDTDVGDLYKNK